MSGNLLHVKFVINSLQCITISVGSLYLSTIRYSSYIIMLFLHSNMKKTFVHEAMTHNFLKVMLPTYLCFYTIVLNNVMNLYSDQSRFRMILPKLESNQNLVESKSWIRTDHWKKCRQQERH